MPITVLIVDDSHFFQRVLSEIINENKLFKVVGIANNGREAIDKVNTLKPDVVTMDYEMPMMDGVTAVREIMATNPLPILMLSSMTFSGAKITIDALEAGAADFMTKNFAEISGKGAAIKKRLYDTLSALTKSRALTHLKTETNDDVTCYPADNDDIPEVCRPSPIHKKPDLAALGKKVKLIAIGASTGGPAALTELLKKIPANFRFPILIIQHMPQNFTLAFSQRLNKQCMIDVKEAEDGDYLLPGRALLAPGGKQLIIDKNNSNRIKVTESNIDINYKPSVDISFASLSNTYGHSTLGIILTGMGSDGCDGARLLKENKSTIWTQTESSCVVYGMPMAVDKAHISSASLGLSEMADNLIQL